MNTSCDAPHFRNKVQIQNTLFITTSKTYTAKTEKAATFISPCSKYARIMAITIPTNAEYKLEVENKIPGKVIAPKTA